MKVLIKENNYKLLDTISVAQVQTLFKCSFPTKNFENSTFMHLISLQEEFFYKPIVFETKLLKAFYDKFYLNNTEYHIPYYKNQPRNTTVEGKCPISYMLAKNINQAISVTLDIL